MDMLTYISGPEGKTRFEDEKYEGKDKAIPGVRLCEEKYEGN